MKNSAGPIIFIFFALLFFAMPVYCAAIDGVVNDDGGDDRQFRINKAVLENGPSDEMRNDAAMELLLCDNTEARGVLIQILENQDNPQAVKAVCTALVDSRTENEVIANKSDFIVPLEGVLINGSGKDAELASEALLVYSFGEIQESLRAIIQSEQSSRQAKLNAILAISVRPADKNAIAELVELLDNQDKEIVEAASSALPYWVPKGMDRGEILRDLRRKSQEEIIRDRVVYLEEQLRKVSSDRDKWLGLYMNSLDKSFESADTSVKGSMIFEQLEKTKAAVLKIWALNKILAQVTDVELPEGFAGRLIELITDTDKDVRLSTANVLTKMSNLSSPETLLEQLRNENNDQVRLALFESLGEACYYSLLSSAADANANDQIRQETLNEADTYLENDDAVKAKIGAVVIRKLIEPNGMDKEITKAHLEKILRRYERSEGELKSDLLNVMTKISGQNANKQLAGALYKDSFVKALTEGGSGTLLKQAAARGLANIDKPEALKVFTDLALYEGNDSTVTSIVIGLAGEIGKAEDVNWLSKKISSNGVSEIAWQAMRDILLRQNADVIIKWTKELLANNGNADRVQELIDIASQKAASQSDSKNIIKTINEELMPALLKSCLMSGDAAGAADIVAKRIETLRAGDKVLEVLEVFMGSAEVGTQDKGYLLELLAGIKKPVSEKAASIWAEKLNMWSQGYSATNEATE